MADRTGNGGRRPKIAKLIVLEILIIVILLLVIFRDQLLALVLQALQPLYHSGFEDIVP